MMCIIRKTLVRSDVKTRGDETSLGIRARSFDLQKDNAQLIISPQKKWRKARKDYQGTVSVILRNKSKKKVTTFFFYFLPRQKHLTSLSSHLALLASCTVKASLGCFSLLQCESTFQSTLYKRLSASFAVIVSFGFFSLLHCESTFQPPTL